MMEGRCSSKEITIFGGRHPANRMEVRNFKYIMQSTQKDRGDRVLADENRVNAGRRVESAKGTQNQSLDSSNNSSMYSENLHYKGKYSESSEQKVI